MIPRNNEKLLISKIRQDKDIESLFQLLNEGIILSLNIASQYPGKLDRNLLIGLIGWRQALDKYDLSKDYKFSTYSTYFIKKAIEDSLV